MPPELPDAPPFSWTKSPLGPSPQPSAGQGEPQPEPSNRLFLDRPVGRSSYTCALLVHAMHTHCHPAVLVSDSASRRAPGLPVPSALSHGLEYFVCPLIKAESEGSGRSSLSAEAALRS